MPLPSSEALAEALVGRYTVQYEIGRGGMASVYLADDVRHGRQVAIKVMLPEMAAGLGIERFLREIRLLARLQHPHILPLYDSGEIAGVLFFVMPYVEGESLRALLRRDGAQTLEHTARIVRHIADALDYAHARGVVHRDLKPENVLLSSGQALLADFGVAHVGVGGLSDDGGTLTGAATTLGTPTYMSPEQAAGASLDHRSDIYSLGCVCFELLSGRPPFAGDNLIALIGQHLTAPPPPLIDTRTPLPADVPTGIHRALAKQPSERFDSAGALAAVLEHAMIASRTPSPADQRLQHAAARDDARPRVLVLEFANLTGAADADWLSTGIAETVAADLNQIASLKVVGQDAEMRRRMAAARHGRTLADEVAADVGRAAGARWVLWGSFQKVGPRIRLTPRFVDTHTGIASSGNKVDGVMDDIFDLQDRIVTGFARVLQLDLSSDEVAQIQKPPTDDVSAYEHYALGHQAFLKFGQESVRTAAQHFRAAIAIDPDYALALAGLGIICGPMFIASGRRELLDEGISLLERALAIDSSLGEAYAWLTYMQFRQELWDDSEQTGRLGVERDPTSHWAWYMLGIGRVARAFTVPRPSDLAAAVPPLVRVLRLNPDYHAAYIGLCHLYLVRGEYGHAAMLADRSLAIERAGSGLQFIGSFVQRAALHVGAGELDQARGLLEQAVARYAGADHVYADVAHAYARWLRGAVEERAGQHDRARVEFAAGADAAAAAPHRIGIGAHWVKCRLGLARSLYCLGDREAANRLVAEAEEAFRARERFVWTYVMGGTDAEVFYELAATHATLRREELTVGSLMQAADAGWGDAMWLRHDPAFLTLRDSPRVQRLCLDASARVRVPPPVGPGGLE